MIQKSFSTKRKNNIYDRIRWLLNQLLFMKTISCVSLCLSTPSAESIFVISIFVDTTSVNCVWEIWLSWCLCVRTLQWLTLWLRTCLHPSLSTTGVSWWTTPTSKCVFCSPSVTSSFFLLNLFFLHSKVCLFHQPFDMGESEYLNDNLW